MFTGLERFRRRKWGKDWGGHSIFVKVHKLWVPVLVLLWTHSKAFWAYSLFPVGLILVDKLIGRLRDLPYIGRQSSQGLPEPGGHLQGRERR